MILDHKLDAGDIIVLDGAMGTEVARYGAAMDSTAWCAMANKTHPDVVRTVHEDYIRAGADVITANTFATCRHVLDGAGIGDEAVAINRRAVPTMEVICTSWPQACMTGYSFPSWPTCVAVEA